MTLPVKATGSKRKEQQWLAYLLGKKKLFPGPKANAVIEHGRGDAWEEKAGAGRNWCRLRW